MECVPWASAAVVNVAWPAASSGPVPSVVVPSMNVTVPVGVPGETLVTVAVNVTDCPVTDGLGAETRAVVVGAETTFWPTPAEVLPAKVESPAYVAVMVCRPTASVEVLKVAVPALIVPVPIAASPSKNVTVPVGFPVVALFTVAVKVTD